MMRPRVATASSDSRAVVVAASGGREVVRRGAIGCRRMVTEVGQGVHSGIVVAGLATGAGRRVRACNSIVLAAAAGARVVVVVVRGVLWKMS